MSVQILRGNVGTYVVVVDSKGRRIWAGPASGVREFLQARAALMGGAR